MCVLRVFEFDPEGLEVDLLVPGTFWDALGRRGDDHFFETADHRSAPGHLGPDAIQVGTGLELLMFVGMPVGLELFHNMPERSGADLVQDDVLYRVGHVVPGQGDRAIAHVRRAQGERGRVHPPWQRHHPRRNLTATWSAGPRDGLHYTRPWKRHQSRRSLTGLWERGMHRLRLSSRGSCSSGLRLPARGACPAGLWLPGSRSARLGSSRRRPFWLLPAGGLPLLGRSRLWRKGHDDDLTRGDDLTHSRVLPLNSRHRGAHHLGHLGRGIARPDDVMGRGRRRFWLFEDGHVQRR